MNPNRLHWAFAGASGVICALACLMLITHAVAKAKALAALDLSPQARAAAISTIEVKAGGDFRDARVSCRAVVFGADPSERQRAVAKVDAAIGGFRGDMDRLDALDGPEKTQLDHIAQTGATLVLRDCSPTSKLAQINDQGDYGKHEEKTKAFADFNKSAVDIQYMIHDLSAAHAGRPMTSGDETAIAKLVHPPS